MTISEDIKTGDLVALQRLAPLQSHIKIAEAIKKFYNPFGEPNKERVKWIEGLNIPEEGEIVYFAGCTAAYKYPDLARNTVKILRHVNASFTLLREREACCGSALLRTGQREYAPELARLNTEAIAEAGASRIITSCAGCFRTFKADYPKLLGKIDFEVLHITQYLAELIDQGKLRFTNKIKEIVTYHDPCHLGRHSGVFEEPRKIIKNLPGLEFREMGKIGKYSRCCGAGGGVKSGFADLAIAIATSRIEEAISTGADTLLSACPFCRVNLIDAINIGKKDIKMKDITEVVSEALGI
jgi:heterodisulfide reductase subunit D